MENKQVNKPNPEHIKEKVKELHNQGVHNAEILQAMASIAYVQGDITLARKLANTAQELLDHIR